MTDDLEAEQHCRGIDQRTFHDAVFGAMGYAEAAVFAGEGPTVTGHLDAAIGLLLRARALLAGLPDEGPELGVLKEALLQFEPRRREEFPEGALRRCALQRTLADGLHQRVSALLGNACASCRRPLTEADWETARLDPLGAGRVCGGVCHGARVSVRERLP